MSKIFLFGLLQVNRAETFDSSFSIVIHWQLECGSCAIEVKAYFPAVSSSNQPFLIDMQTKNALSNIRRAGNCLEIPNKGEILARH